MDRSKLRYRTVLELPDQGYSKVEIHGSWDDWKEYTSLTKHDVLWRCQLLLPLAEYRYQFKADGKFVLHPDRPTVPNVYGTVDNLLEMNKIPVYLRLSKQGVSFQNWKSKARAPEYEVIKRQVTEKGVSTLLTVRGQMLENLIAEEIQFDQSHFGRQDLSSLTIETQLTGMFPESTVKAVAEASAKEELDFDHPIESYSKVKQLLTEGGLSKQITLFALIEGHNGERSTLHSKSRLFEIYSSQPQCLTSPRDSLIDTVAALQSELASEESGCSLTAVLIIENELYVANVGGCQAMLGSGSRTSLLCFQHSPTNRRERIRVGIEGGKFEVTQLFSDNTITNSSVKLFPGSKLTRSLGDASLKAAAKGLSSLADVFSYKLQSSDEYLLVGTSQLFRHLSPAQCAAIMRQHLSKLGETELGKCCEQAAGALLEQARKKGLRKNSRCVVLALPDAQPKVPPLMMRK